ncbi:LytTR family DNA-binding domain-containing protein [Ancylobacter mangrovi]|uniref:LytTR family DNA-binding domain-containing protein n=1 Tax=Ancylobacter mangrovi TaxID=2972472 RepID=UPI0021619C9F|nr:LytTR family DNA-binding domain-containing protein [Ancylobacter mangrovi]MCS0503551.1 LytTR family transcriptional regulator [Ancylobacter mangrovi]
MREFASFHPAVRLPRWTAEVGFALALGPAFAWVGPFGTDDEPFLSGLLYWSGMLASWFVVMAITEELLGNAGLFAEARPVAKRAAIIALAAFPMLLIVAPATYLFTGWQVTLLELGEKYVQIVLVGSGVWLIARAALARAPETVSDCPPVQRGTAGALPAAIVPNVPPAAPQLVESRLVQRLAPGLRGRLICLEMEDHYVRVHTERGSALLLLRLSDAMAETAPTAGRQVHRSWWVADDAVDSFVRTGRTGTLRLSNGLSTPVSQRHLKSVETLASSRPAAR